ncbi:hypothetical protein AB0J72_46750 [Dactylosporangium sp. NPDC049742]|uniref:hypothetical protein n=1 Tax=Dactylosporangium sp. NPDC049742 TaxID=3154737 RepID=UPI00343EA56A
MSVLGSLVRNGAVVRAALLAAVSTGALAAGRPLLVPYAVAGYAVWNATALTLAAARSAAGGAPSAGAGRRATVAR